MLNIKKRDGFIVHCFREPSLRKVSLGSLLRSVQLSYGKY